MKKFTFKGVLDGFRSSVQAAPRGTEQEIQETLRPDHFQIKKTFRHGFPFSPTALAWDPIQKLLAVGDKGGNLRILGGPGVDAHVRHDNGEAVLHAKFLVNEGALVTATADDQLHLWTFRQKSPQRVQSLKFQRERITCLHLPLQSKWIHVGTERGNVHVVNIETFALSGYVINWNKAIEVTRQNHPGSVVDISDNPLDASKLLIAFETGLVVVWDLRARSPSLDQLEEGRPTPAASPAEVSVAPEEPISASLPTSAPIEKLENRRKSTTWKTFNLKRQLSKVDLKLKAAFAVPPDNNLDEGDKSNSQFFCEVPDKAEIATEPAIEKTESTPDSDDKNADIEEEDNNTDKSELPSPLRVCSDVFERMHKELQEKRSSDVYDRMHKELQERWQDKDRTDAVSPDLSPSKLDEKTPRPDNLPLFEEDGRPTRPPRQKGKTKKEEEEKRDQRDQRLLSVPNIKYSKQESVKDLRKKQAPAPQSASFAGNLMRRFNKLDSSFSRSRSSSMSSLENISQEGIQCLAFADSYTKKSDPTTLLPTLWIGTTLGSVLTMMISLPEADLRHTQPVVVSTSGGPIFRLKGSILTMSFLDCNGALIPYSYESWKDDSKVDVRDRRERTPTKQSSSSRMSPTPAADGDRQFVVIASEKQARVVALPSQNCVYRQQIVDTDFVVKAEIVSLKDSVCLVNYLSTGHLVAYSLPSLRPLVDVDFLPLSELRIARTFCFSNRGHGLYLASPTEIQKFTIDAEFCQQLNEMLGELFLPRDMPEPPKEGFFRGLFGGGARPLDREELFGEGSGKPSRSTAKHIPGAGAGLEQLGARASTAASEVSRAHQLVLERGDKLSQLEDRTERMHSQASEFSSSAHQLMLKYKDKKWYQL